ncbi:MAG: hemolysin family protein [Acidimicrobiales bacterium]
MRRRLRRHAAAIDAAPSEQELQITNGLRSLRESTAREVMTPRVDVVGLAAPVAFSDVARAVRRSGHSHFPVYKDDFDHLLGVLYVKDLVSREVSADERGRNDATVAGEQMSERLREPYTVPESGAALEILSDMRRKRRGFAVVVDEYGGFAGVLTINDLVSELVGDIHDEFDRAASPAVMRIDDRRFLVDGACGVDELNEEIDVAIPEGEYVTLGGYLLDVLGHIPEESESVELDGATYRITRMDRRRIAKVVVEVPSTTLAPNDAEHSASDGK